MMTHPEGGSHSEQECPQSWFKLRGCESGLFWGPQHSGRDSRMHWHSGKETACQWRRCKRHRLNLWVRKIPWSKKRQPTPVLPGKSHGQRAWQAIVHRVSKSQTQLSQHNLLLQEVRKAECCRRQVRGPLRLNPIPPPAGDRKPLPSGPIRSAFPASLHPLQTGFSALPLLIQSTLHTADNGDPRKSPVRSCVTPKLKILQRLPSGSK